jgi:hypothetical protein
VAEWSCSGLQLRVRRFDSGPSLQYPLKQSLATASSNKYPGPIPNAPLPVAVYLLPDGAKAQVPSFEAWFKILETDFGVFVPLELQQLMIEPYTKMPEGQDVVGLFCEMIGCEATEGVSCHSLDKEYPEVGWPSTGNPVTGLQTSLVIPRCRML